MNGNGYSLLFLVAYVVGFVVVLCLLWVLLMRERVKTSLKERGFKPKHIRWHPFAFWAGPYSAGFTVVYQNDYGIEHRSRCRVFDQVRWIAGEVDYLEKNLPLFGRILYLAIAAVFLYIASRAALAREVFLPPTLRAPRGVHITGEAKDLLALAALFGAASLLTQVAYNYLKRNERLSRTLARSFAVLGWLLFFASFVAYAYTYSK
jgi:hypothetical protein